MTICTRNVESAAEAAALEEGASLSSEGLHAEGTFPPVAVDLPTVPDETSQMSFIALREQARMVRAAMPAVMAWRDGIKHERRRYAASAWAEGWLRRKAGGAGPLSGSQSMRSPPVMTERVGQTRPPSRPAGRASGSSSPSSGSTDSERWGPGQARSLPESRPADRGSRRGIGVDTCARSPSIISDTQSRTTKLARPEAGRTRFCAGLDRPPCSPRARRGCGGGECPGGVSRAARPRGEGRMGAEALTQPDLGPMVG
jgi:hypothetical protein